jgi:hypothetical protein
MKGVFCKNWQGFALPLWLSFVKVCFFVWVLGSLVFSKTWGSGWTWTGVVAAGRRWVFTIFEDFWSTSAPTCPTDCCS